MFNPQLQKLIDHHLEVIAGSTQILTNLIKTAQKPYQVIVRPKGYDDEDPEMVNVHGFNTLKDAEAEVNSYDDEDDVHCIILGPNT